MKRIVIVCFMLAISLQAAADLSTAQKINCAKDAIKKILNARFDIIDDSINLEKTPMEKYNVVANAADKLARLEGEQNFVSFLVKDSNNTYAGKIILETEHTEGFMKRNNSSVIANDYSGTSFRCTLTTTQFTMTKESAKTIELSDLGLKILSTRSAAPAKQSSAAK
ncbi:MAG: hypothetical protein ABL927_00250 [Bdellovibrionales bacterium]